MATYTCNPVAGLTPTHFAKVATQQTGVSGLTPAHYRTAWAATVRMRAWHAASGSHVYWAALDGRADSTGAWWPGTGGVAFSSLTDVVQTG